MRLWVLFFVMAFAGSVAAQSPSSMTADEAYVRALTYFQGVINGLRVEQAQRDALRDAAILNRDDRLVAVEAELIRLRSQAAAKDVTARVALTAFAQGQGGQGLNVLERRAQNAPRSASPTLPSGKSASAEEWKQVGALAFPIDYRRAVDAYKQALALEPDDAESLSQMVRLQSRLGNTGEARAFAQRLTESSEPHARAFGLMCKGLLALNSGDQASAESLLGAALALSKSAGLKDIEADTLEALSAVANRRGRRPESDKYLVQALQINETLDRKLNQASNLASLASNALNSRKADLAENYAKRALAIFEQAKYDDGVGAALLTLGGIARSRGDATSTEGHYNQALGIFRRSGFLLGQATALNGLGDLARARGDLVQGQSRLEQAIALYKKVGEKIGQGSASYNLGLLLQARGDAIGACRQYEEALGLLKGTKSAGSARAKLTLLCGRPLISKRFGD
jgi:tetratricopeptide (TPR) repeat protein